MTVVLAKRSDITLDAYYRVAWQGEDVTIAEQALAIIAAARASFLALLDANPKMRIYGVTTAHHTGAATLLSQEERQAYASQLPRSGFSFGEPLPERVVRGMVLARLANYLEGHAAVRSELVREVARMLQDSLPDVPGQANGGAGEILALGHLFRSLSERFPLEPKEPMALVNGSPCSAALLADVVLSTRNRLELAEQVFALAAEAIRVPLEHFAADLEALWGDPHDTAALRRLRELLAGGAVERRPYQAPVSFRIIPRVLGQVRRALAAAEAAADISLCAVTDNPVYVPPDDSRSLGMVMSTGGFHNAMASPTIDSINFAFADLCQLAEHETERLVESGSELALAEQEPNIVMLYMVQAGWAEEARMAAQPTLLPLGGVGPTDTPTPTFFAWRKAQEVGSCLDAALAVLAVVSSFTLHVGERRASPGLAPILEEIHCHFPPEAARGPIGRNLQALSAAFSRRVFERE